MSKYAPYSFRDVLAAHPYAKSSSFNSTVKSIKESVIALTGHGISKEYSDKIQNEILPSMTVEQLNAMIYHAKTRSGSFSNDCMVYRRKGADEEETK